MNPDTRTAEGNDANAGATNGGTTQGPITSAGMFQQQRNENAVQPGTRSEDQAAFPWHGDGSTVTYEGREITTTVQADGSVIYRTSAGAVPFERALGANGATLAPMGECTELDDAQECVFRVAA